MMSITNPVSAWLIVTDLDGTLLDHYDYNWHAAQPALDFLQQHKVPVVINTSKTSREVMSLQKQIGITAAFIVENGSAIFIPGLDKLEPLPELDFCNGYWVKVLGQAKGAITKKLHELRKRRAWAFEGFSDWTVEQIIAATGLSEEAAHEASQRQFSEPLIWNDSEANYQIFLNEIHKLGMKILKGGRFIHVLGNTDKGAAALWLKHFFTQHYNVQFKLVALGDGPNDVDMLNASNIAVAVKSPVHEFPRLARKEAVIFTHACGPAGWNEAIQALRQTLKANPAPFRHPKTGKYHG